MKDTSIRAYITEEFLRQQNTIELIASENIASKDVMEAVGSIFTNKYAEGKPFKRYYNGCQVVDFMEQLTCDRFRELFNTDYHVNVQPHSGAQANMAVFEALLDYGDTVLSMDLSNGGHLSHGSPVNYSGKHFNVIQYGINENGEIDYDEVERLAVEHKPKLIICGASNYSKIIDFKRFAEIRNKIYEREQSENLKAHGFGFENSKTSNITINDISLPSDNDIRTRIFCKIKDLAHKFFLQEQKRKENYYMGNWHTHPQKSPTPSSIDIDEWKNVITKDRTGSDYAFFIIFGTEEFKAWYGNYNTKQICELKEYIVKK